MIPVAFIALLAGAFVWSGGSATRRADFAYIDRGDVFTLDLNQISYMQDFRMMYAIREGLYSPAPVTSEPIPAGATGYDLSPDKRVWTFHLRDNVKWSNGDPVTARDYVFSYRRMLEEPGEYTYLFFCFKNAQKYQEDYADNKPTADFKTVGIEAVDDKTLRLTLAEPLTYLLEFVAFPVFYPRHEPSMRPFRSFTDSDVMDSLAMCIDDPVAILKNAIAAGRTDHIGVRKFVNQCLALKLEKADDLKDADDNRVVGAIRAFAELKPFAPDSPEGKKLNDMASRGFFRSTYRADYTRPAPKPGKPGVITNGPYVLKQWDFKRRLLLEKSQTYWDRANVSVERIEKVVNDNSLSQFLMYERGEVDWNSDVPGDLAAELRARGRKDLRTSPAFGTMFLTLMRRDELPESSGGGKNPLADVRVRQALAMATDKQFVVDNITRMGELPARTYLPPDGTLPDFRWLPGPFDTSRKPDHPYAPAEIRDLLTKPAGNDGPGLPYDVKKARELLAEAGFPDGKGFPAIPILFGSDNTTRGKIAQAMKNQWKRNLNIDITIQTVEGKIFKERVSKKDYAIATVTWFGDYADASTFTDKYLSTSLQNDSDWRNPAFDALIVEAQKETDVVKRGQILSRAEHMIDTEVPIIPIYHYVNAYLSRDNVNGVEPNPRSLTVFKAVRINR